LNSSINTSIYLIAKENIEINKGETLSFCNPYIISIFDVVAVKTMAKETQRVIFIKIDIISLKPVSYTETEKNSNITLLSPLLINGKNNAKSMKGISIESLLKYVLTLIFEIKRKYKTIKNCKNIKRLFSRLKKAIEKTIQNVVNILSSGFNSLNIEFPCISK